ncbi:hypothetical protein LX36DRAFT_712311 [Colletotrichum falcatum]|nr:hypothetical protein LX36DRAFT_712311 [Colletotrichum falcatum]
MAPVETPGPDPEKRVPSGTNPAAAAAAEEGQPVSKHRIADEAGAVAASALGSAPPDEAQSRAVLRKLDKAGPAVPFIDKTSLGVQLGLNGIIPDNRLAGPAVQLGEQHLLLFGPLAAEDPGVAVLQRFPVAKFSSAPTLCSGGGGGAVLMTTAACGSFAGLASVRASSEAPPRRRCRPGFVAVTGMYVVDAAGAGGPLGALGVVPRVSAASPATLLAYGIGHVRGRFAPWRYMYLILGAATRVVAVQQVVENKTGPAVVVLGLVCLGFGFNPLQTTPMNLPLPAVQVVAQLGASFLTSRIPGSRLRVTTVSMVPPIIGTLLINQLHLDNKWGRLAGV